MALAPGDFNASGAVDLAVGTATYDPTGNAFALPSYVNVLTGDGKGGFQLTGRHSVGILNNFITADLNGDGRSDIVYTANYSQGTGTTNYLGLGVDLSEGPGAFSTATYSYPSSFLTTGMITGDFNRDGKLDVVVLGLFSNGGDVALLLGAGGGVLNKTRQYYPGAMGQAIVLDINGDGAPDIAGTTTVGVARLLNTGHK